MTRNMIPESKWSFDGIRHVDTARADRLEQAKDPGQLVCALAAAVCDSIHSGNIRLAIDSVRNEFVERRSILQFVVSPELYDWFYSARSGYRAHFWQDVKSGSLFNEKIVAAISEVLYQRLPELLSVRAITLLDADTHEEQDAGEMQVTRAEFLRSFQPRASKIWLCERRYSKDGAQPEDIGSVELREATRTGRLIVPRWDRKNPDTEAVAEGLLAPYPAPENAWLDLKGGFVSTDGQVKQAKPQDVRAYQIRNYGWTWRSMRKHSVGVLAYGSLIEDPGEEVLEVMIRVIENVQTPFNVEFARSSTSRDGAPTLVPVAGFGRQVIAKILVLDTTADDTADRLYRRERHITDQTQRYVHRERPGRNAVIIERLSEFHGLDTVLYTLLGANISNLDAKELARLAINSALKRDDGNDGISYLNGAKKHGIRTNLSDAYEEEILKALGAKDLYDALRLVRERRKG